MPLAGRLLVLVKAVNALGMGMLHTMSQYKDCADADADADSDDEQSDGSNADAGPWPAAWHLRPGIVHRLDKGTTGDCCHASVS